VKYNTERKAIIRARRRKILMAALDDQCAECGTTEALEFDHVNPATKSFVIADSLDFPWPVLFAEIVKCQLLCHQHHLAKSMANGELGWVEHGGGLSGKRNCKCEPCRAKKREYMQAYMQRRRAAKGV
jgi:5-methylcytosine-specific restriction endonuclease McrA